MASKGGRVDFMFLGPPYPATGSATDGPWQMLQNSRKSTAKLVVYIDNGVDFFEMTDHSLQWKNPTVRLTNQLLGMDEPWTVRY